MNSKERKARIKPNAVFTVGGRRYQVIEIEGVNVRVKDLTTGNRINYGVDALARINITFCN